MSHRKDRRQSFEKFKVLERNGKKPGKKLAGISEEFEAIDSVLRHELPILHDKVMKVMALLFEYLVLAQTQWVSKWKEMFQRLTGRAGIPGWAYIVADFHRNFGTMMEEDFVDLEITGSSQPQRKRHPSLGTRRTLLRPEKMPDLRSRYAAGQDENDLGSSKGSDELQEVFASAPSEHDASGPSKPDYNVLWLAVSLFDFYVERDVVRNKREAGYPYLFYKIGEVCPGRDTKAIEYRLTIVNTGLRRYRRKRGTLAGCEPGRSQWRGGLDMEQALCKTCRQLASEIIRLHMCTLRSLHFVVGVNCGPFILRHARSHIGNELRLHPELVIISFPLQIPRASPQSPPEHRHRRSQPPTLHA